MCCIIICKKIMYSNMYFSYILRDINILEMEIKIVIIMKLYDII